MFLHFAAQTGLRLSEIVPLERDAVVLDTGVNLPVCGKVGRERGTPGSSDHLTCAPRFGLWKPDSAGGDSVSQHPWKQSQPRCCPAMLVRHV